VPGDHLVQESKSCVEIALAEGIDLAENWDFAWTRIAAHLARRFEVSTQVVERRLRLDGVPDLFRRSS
jgi:hypothetical protein